MDYQKTVADMLTHAVKAHQGSREKTALEMGLVVKALGEGIATIATGLPVEHIPLFIKEVAYSIATVSGELLSEESGVFGAETFLRDHFKPGVFND